MEENREYKHLKNIYLIGPSRCGKTTTAEKLTEHYNYTHLIMDAFIETLSDFSPQLGIRHGNLESQEFKEFLTVFSKSIFKYTQHNIIDLETLSPAFAQTIIDPEESTAIYLGYPSITPEEKLRQIRQYDTAYD